MIKFKDRKAWLDYLYYKVGNQQYDFELCGLKKVNGEVKATKWYKYSELCFPLDFNEGWKINWVNNRTIFPNEVVLDIEDKSLLDEVVEKLRKFKIKNYYIYETGSRGYHIHIFSTKPVTSDIKEFFCHKFGADVTKANERVMIALEWAPHWKSGKIKRLIMRG